MKKITFNATISVTFGDITKNEEDAINQLNIALDDYDSMNLDRDVDINILLDMDSKRVAVYD